MRNILSHIFRLLGVLLIQTLLIDQISLSVYVRPAFYIYFLLCLPVSFPRWIELLIGFGVGITMDCFSNTLGLHAFCCVLISYLRPFLIQLFVSEEDRKAGMTPSLELFGWNTYLKLTSILVCVHHCALFALESFSFTYWWETFLRIILSSIVCFLLITIFEVVKKSHQ